MVLDDKICATSQIMTKYGDFTIMVIKGEEKCSAETVVLIHGDIEHNQPIVRIHSECMTGDVFHSLMCDCNEQLDIALNKIGNSNAGILIYLRQEGRGIGLFNKIKAYKLQMEGLNTIDANVELGLPVDDRSYNLAADILKALCVTDIKLLTNNPEKVTQLEKNGIYVTRIPCITVINEYNSTYIYTKKNLMNHMV